ncbi:MAG: hypothetical protein JSW00_09545 [Thermoplasmata archaeon]|nr:MAG: hypothetical protein JSW00_09545 [Thermoplasmata archaeon]
MHIKPVEEIIAEIKSCYDHDPYGWRMLRGRDRAGHYDTYIMNRRSLWQMKTEFKNPYQPKGVGTKIMDKPDKEIEILMEMGEALPFGELYHQQKSHPIYTLGVGRYSKSAANQLKGIISSKQEEVEKNLTENLDKFLHREGICKDYL